MYCPNCGKLIPDDAKFCTQCGNKINILLIESSYKVVMLKTPGYFSKITFLQEVINIISYVTGISSLDAHKRILEKFPHTYIAELNQRNANYLADKLTKMGFDSNVEREDKPENIDYNEKVDILRSGAIICPRCHNTSITTGQRGFSLVTGFIGSNQTVNRCAKCGYSWKP